MHIHRNVCIKRERGGEIERKKERERKGGTTLKMYVY